MKKIVICEDNLKTQRDLRIACNTSLSQIIHEFNNGYDLVEWVKEHPKEAHLIILDIIMKKMDGFVAFHEIKKINPDLPIIIISIENSVPLIKYLAQHGIRDFIPKPYDLGQLKNRILHHIKKI